MSPVVARHAAGVVAAATILAPLPTMALPFRSSLVARAGLVAAVVAGLAVVAVLTPGWTERLRGRPRPLLLGCACYSAAAVLGALVAVARGCDPTRLAGQLLAMGLLPAAALAGLALPECWRSLRTGVVAAVAVGGAVQVCWWSWSLTRASIADRLYLPNAVSVVGPALLALTLAVSMLGARPRRARAAVWLCMLIVAVVIAGSAVRALWVLVLPCLLLQLALGRGLARLARPQVVLAAGGLAALALVGHLLFAGWIQADRPSLLADAPADAFQVPQRLRSAVGPDGSLELDPARIGRFRSPVFAVDEPGAYVLEARATGGDRGAAQISLRWLDADRRPIGRLGVRFEAGADEGVLTNFGVAPEGTRYGLVRFSGDRRAEGTWNLSHLSLERLGHPRLAPLLRQRRVWLRRMASVAGLLVGRQPSQDPALAFRLAESLRVLREIRQSRPSEWLVGRGLGATVHLGVEGYDNRGNRVWYGHVNYIHNLYLFLVLKLGLVGTALVLTALVAWIGWSLRQTLTLPVGERRAFLGAVTAAWIAYSVWGVTSPELIDFAMAPLFGLLVAGAADAGME